MKKKKVQKKQKILAVILSVMMLMSLMPNSFLPAMAASDSHEECYTVKVTDEENQAVANATVEWKIFADADGKQEITESVTATSAMTDADGIIEVADIKNLVDNAEDGTVYFQITKVSAEGYVDYQDVTIYAVTDPLEEKQITLTKEQVEQKYFLTGKVTDENNVPLSGVNVFLQDGTKVQTAEDGTYSLEVLKGEQYKVSYSLENYHDASADITISGENDTCDMVLQKIKLDATFKFENERPLDITYGEFRDGYTNTAVAESDPEATIVYSITQQTDLEGNAVDANQKPISVADIDPATGKVSIKRSGIITVQATREKDELFDETVIQYTLTINKAERTGYAFSNAVPEDQYLADGKIFDNPYTNGESGGDKDVKYEIVDTTAKDTSVDQNGRLKYGSVGTITVKATKPSDDCYEAVSGTYTVQILKKEQTGFLFRSSEPVFSYGTNDNHYLNIVEGGEGDGSVTYRIVGNTDIAEINEQTGDVTVKKSGEVTVQATKAEDDYYTVATAEYKLTVSKGIQTGFSFERQNPEVITWNDTNNNCYTNVATGGSGTGSVSYTITAGSDVANIDEKTGSLTFNQAGKVTVKATKEEDDCYESAEASYQIEMLKADQVITFAEESINLEYGTPDYIQSVDVRSVEDAADGKGYGTGAISYRLEDNTLDAQIDAKSGKVTFADDKVGSVTIIATKEVDACYNECEVRYTLTIQYMAAPETTYQLHGTQNRTDEHGSAETFFYDGDSTEFWFTDTVTIKAPEGYLISRSNHFSDNTWTDSVLQETEGQGDVTFYLKNKESGGITDALTVQSLKIDKEDPTDLQISYPGDSDKINAKDSVLYGKDKVRVEITARDITAGLQAFYYQYQSNVISTSSQGKEWTKADLTSDSIGKTENKDGTVSYSFEIPAQFRGNVSFKAVDQANRVTECWDKTTVVADNRNPNALISYTAQKDSSLIAKVEKDTTDASERRDVAEEQIDENTRFIYNGAVTAFIDMTEANFEAEDVVVTVTKDGKEIWNGPITEKQTLDNNCKISAWDIDAENDKEQLTIQLLSDGDYQIGISYQDGSDNKMHYESTEYEQKTGEEIYMSNIISIDTTDPEVEVIYDNNDVTNQYYYKKDRVATIKVTDRNFRPSEVDWKITAKDGDAVIDPKTVEGGAADDVTYNYSDLKDWSEWKQDEKDPSVWYTQIVFDQDAYYNTVFACQDLAGHALKENATDAFVVDKSKTKLDQMQITYSKELHTWQKVWNAITFGYFGYKDQVTVTLTSEDEMSGIDYLTWTYQKEDGASSKNVEKRTEKISRDQITYSKRGKQAVASFNLKATDAEQFRGAVSFTATDMAGNVSEVKSDSQRINIVDNISPERTVSYSPAEQVVDATTGLTKSFYHYEQEGTNSILYYAGDVTVTFRVEEANFYAEDVEVAVNGVQKKPEDWTQAGDVWTSHLTLHGDGDYYVTMSYTDRSDNEMHFYKSEKIVIDTKKPVVQVTYGNSDVKGADGERQYFDRIQTATIRITEHNFRADDVVADVTAVDVTGKKVAVADYAAYLSNRNNWKKDGDVYTAVISYPVDANYTFDISYHDLALNEAADYIPDLFTVDQTVPGNLNISYSESLQMQQIGVTPFRYYNQMMTVTISGEDATSGIEHFVYNYRNGSGVSAVNAQLLDAAIQKAEVVQEGTRFTARFTIPRSVLQANNQFNGTVDFIAYDYATNQSGLNDSERIVVDNLAPTASVTYNDPVQESNGVAYYAGDIAATIEIREANFYAEDVQVSVEKDGQSYGPNVSWTDHSADIHTGTFRLSEDGDYMITVNYTDRSGNRMETYTSGQLTVDTEHPTIYVSGLQADSAHKEDPYGFTLTVSDNADNLPAGDITPVLTAITCDEDGNYSTQEVELPALEMTENNQSYNIHVENLEQDGIYTLSCKAKDLANQEYNLMTLDDGQEYETVTFSVNRNGSTFRIDEATTDLLNQYYVYQVPQDVVIEEINTDLIENYAVKMNGKVLTEGADYTTNGASSDGTWSVRTYSVKKELFEEEGEYDLVVESVDKTDTASYSDVKNLKLGFIVDQTAPAVTFSGLEKGGRYEAQEQTVTAVPTDDGGKLKTFRAVLMDKKGESKETLIDLSGEELENYLAEHDGQIDFKIPEGLEQQVAVTCADYAVKEDGTTNTYQETFNNVTVSTNKVIIFFANKPLFYGVIIVCGAAAAGVIAFIAWKKKKKTKTETKAE